MIIDIGNSKIKLATFEGFSLIKEFFFEVIEDMVSVVRQLKFDQIIVSSVKWSHEELKTFFPFTFLFLTYRTPLPIQNAYTTPETLGMDRIAAVVGALGFRKKGPLLTIDLGTCITYDFLNKKGAYVGGAISPGIKMRFEAMHNQTAKLPSTGLTGEQVELVGDSTATCLKSGVYYGTKYEIEGIVAHYKNQYGELNVFICGGDANFFESLTKDYIFVIPNLILHGLNRILIYNVNKK